MLTFFLALIKQREICAGNGFAILWGNSRNFFFEELVLRRVLLNGIIMNEGGGLVGGRNWGMVIDVGVGGSGGKRGI